MNFRRIKKKRYNDNKSFLLIEKTNEAKCFVKFTIQDRHKLQNFVEKRRFKSMPVDLLILTEIFFLQIPP